MDGVMEDVVIKTEPLDDEFPSIGTEELIIKTEGDDASSTNNPAVPELPLDTPFVTIIPKSEPLDDYENLAPINSFIELLSPTPNPPVKTKKFVTKKVQANSRSLRCRNLNACPECNQVFRTYVILQDHLEQHRIQKAKKVSPSKEKTSPKAGRAISKSNSKLSPKQSPDILAKSYEHPKFYSCNVCDMTFSSPKGLRSHKRVHNGKKYVCDQCGRSFTYSMQLKQHKKGNICMTEAGEEIISFPEIDLSIKKEVLSDKEETSIPAVESGEVENKPVIKQEPSENNTQNVPTPVIKQEPDDSEDDQSSDSNKDYDELLLQELIDRKARSIANQKAAMLNQKSSLDTSIKREPSFSETSSNQSVGIPMPIKRKLTNESLSDDMNRSSASQSDSQHHDDFEDMIASNTLLNFQNKRDVINSLKEEYQKAKKKKMLDDNNQEEDETKRPRSLYTTLTNIPEDLTFTAGGNRYRYVFVCSICPRRYVQRHGFLRHLLSSHTESILEPNMQRFELRPELCSTKLSMDTYCFVCRVTLVDSDSLKKHNEEVHKMDGAPASTVQYQCEKCGKYCSTRGFLADHIQANCGREPQYKCDECGKKFHTKSTLNLHKTLHTGVLPHKCGYCEKRFRTKGQLTVHTRTHTGERPFPCKVCDRRFTHRETLIAHLSRHIDMKRYKCYACSMLFSCISGLKTHRITRMNTCGRVKLNARPVGPRVRVIRGNVIFEPQPKINPYFRGVDEKDTPESQKDQMNEENEANQENQENVFNVVAETMKDGAM